MVWESGHSGNLFLPSQNCFEQWMIQATICSQTLLAPASCWRGRKAGADLPAVTSLGCQPVLPFWSECLIAVKECTWGEKRENIGIINALSITAAWAETPVGLQKLILRANNTSAAEAQGLLGDRYWLVTQLHKYHGARSHRVNQCYPQIVWMMVPTHFLVSVSKRA